jgi:hypothetical protein
MRIPLGDDRVSGGLTPLWAVWPSGRLNWGKVRCWQLPDQASLIRLFLMRSYAWSGCWAISPAAEVLAEGTEREILWRLITGPHQTNATWRPSPRLIRSGWCPGTRFPRAWARVRSRVRLSVCRTSSSASPVARHGRRAVPVQRRGLLTALGVQDGPSPEPFLVSLATLSLVSKAAEHSPLLIGVDDLHWLDEVSRRAVTFVAVDTTSTACSPSWTSLLAVSYRHDWRSSNSHSLHSPAPAVRHRRPRPAGRPVRLGG